MTRIPKGAHSTANFLVIVACAVFAAAEWASPEKPVQMYCAELLTIAPPSPRAIRRRANSVEHRKVPSIAIRDLLARYTYNGDRGRVAELAACFAADGILEYPGNRAEGPEAIAKALGGVGGTRDPALTFVRHHITNPLIDLTGDTATARSYFAVHTDIGPDHSGTYDDKLVRVDD